VATSVFFVSKSALVCGVVTMKVETPRAVAAEISSDMVTRRAFTDGHESATCRRIEFLIVVRTSPSSSCWSCEKMARKKGEFVRKSKRRLETKILCMLLQPYFVVGANKCKKLKTQSKTITSHDSNFE
jgi:hypothetical protein